MDEKIAALQAGVWLWDKYGKTILDKGVGLVISQWEKFNWKQASESYRQKIRSRYGTMHIFGMAEPVSLEGIYTDVFMLDKVAAFRRFDIKSFFEEIQKQENKNPNNPNRKKQNKEKRNSHFQHVSIDVDLRRRNAFGVISKINKLFILGKPGAGKTTLLKFIALKASEGQIDRIPIFISLKEWSDSELDLYTFIIKQFEICSFPDPKTFIDSVLGDGKSIILFDGLDEVNQENQQRIKLVTSLKNFIDQYDKNQFLITCRIAASDYSFQNFTYVEVADFNDDQIRTFAGKWFGKNAIKRGRFLSDLDNKDNEGLKELASIPLLLTLLCLAFDETMSFPQRRVEIYEEATEALLKKWDTSRNIKRDDVYRKLSLGRKRQLLARIAAETFENSEYFIQQERLQRKIVEYLRNLPPSDVGEDDIDGETLLKSLEAQHGLLVERAWKIYSFSHLTFHEYFTAKYVADNSTNGTLENLASHVGDDRWREVLLLTTSLLDNADGFIQVLIKSIYDKALQHEQLAILLDSAELKTIDNDASIDYPSRARFLEQDILRYLNSELHPGFSANVQKHLQDINYARSCALELVTKYKVQRALLLVLSLDLILLAKMVNTENARSQNRLYYLSGTEEAANEILDSSPKTKEEIDFIFSKEEMKSIIKAEKGLLAKKDTTLTSCIGSLLSHAGLLSKIVGWSDVNDQLSNIEHPSADTLTNLVSQHKVFDFSLEVINHNGLDALIALLESSLLVCECLGLSYVTDRRKMKNSLLDFRASL